MPAKSTTKKVVRKGGKPKKKVTAKEAARRDAAKAEMARQKLVKEAEVTYDSAGKVKGVKDVFAGLTACHTFSKGGLDLDVEFTSPGDMEEVTRDWTLGLVRRNMKDQYIGARWGWSDGEKRKELEDSHARYLICRKKPVEGAGAAASASAASEDEDKDTDRVVSDSKGELVGFVHFRFMLEGEAPVLYVFEIQCEPRARGKGVGSFLMRALELVAYQEHMHYVMLTVFTSNAGAKRFYSRLGYDLDELSKSPAMLTSDVAYQILSKTIDPEVAASKTTRHRALRGRVDVDEPAAAAAVEA